MPYLLFLKKQQNLKVSSAANYRWCVFAEMYFSSRSLFQTVVLFRNPKDLCVSYYNFYKSSSSFGNFKGEWPEFLDMFIEGYGK